MLVIGLAGGIASGKSFVADCFVNCGSERINADEIGHQVLEQAEVIEAIVARWGDSVLQDSGQIDRKALGRRVFNTGDSSTQGIVDKHEALKGRDDDELKILESITHPRIEERIREQLIEFKRTSDKSAVVMDAPVMFKTGWDQVCDKIVFVHSDIAIRQQRASARGWQKGELERRESFQMTLEEKRQRSTDFVDNSHSKQKTNDQVFQLWQDWNLKVLSSSD
jgi:dephospho-CoA kinase